MSSNLARWSTVLAVASTLLGCVGSEPEGTDDPTTTNQAATPENVDATAMVGHSMSLLRRIDLPGDGADVAIGNRAIAPFCRVVPLHREARSIPPSRWRVTAVAPSPAGIELTFTSADTSTPGDFTLRCLDASGVPRAHQLMAALEDTASFDF